MSAAAVINALALPPESRVDQRVPKKLLVEQGAPTAADKRQIQDSIEELLWIAALKPTNIGVPAYRDDVREYLEIAVISVTLRAATKATRLIELIHRAIPYPVLLISFQGNSISISLAHKRYSEGQNGKVVVEELYKATLFHTDSPQPEEAEFLGNIALSTMPTRDLYALYQGWCDRIAALEAARITGAYTPPSSPERAVELREGLEAHAQLQRELVILRAQATREKQLNRRVELNLQIKRLEAELAAVTNTIGPGDSR
ncbi:MAG: DUF4391 domain-containing protein [Armatimonadota bacterium]